MSDCWNCPLLWPGTRATWFPHWLHSGEACPALPSPSAASEEVGTVGRLACACPGGVAASSPASASRGDCNEVSPAGWVAKTTKTSLPVLKNGSPKSGCWQDPTPSTGSGGDPSSPLQASGYILGAPQPGGRRKALPLGSRPLPLHPSAEKSPSLRGSSKQPSVRWKSKGHNPEFWPAGPALLLALCKPAGP